jgi:hypothetical protein
MMMPEVNITFATVIRLVGCLKRWVYRLKVPLDVGRRKSDAVPTAVSEEVRKIHHWDQSNRDVGDSKSPNRQASEILSKAMVTSRDKIQFSLLPEEDDE